MAVVQIAAGWLIFICLTVTAEAQTETDLTRLRSQIAKQEKELAALSGNKSNVTQQISVLQKKQADERRAASLLIKRQNSNIIKIKDLQNKEKEFTAKQKHYKKQAAIGVAFIIDNGGTYIAKAIMSGADSAKITGVVEVVSRLNVTLSDSIQTYADTLSEIAKIRQSLIDTNTEIGIGLTESKAMTENYLKTQKDLSVKLTLIKHDENAQKEYLKTLRQEQERLTKALRNSAKKTATPDRGVFAKLKGKLPLPMQGKIIERFGKKTIEGTKLTVMHKGVKITPTNSGAVICVADGTVVYADNINGLENVLIIRHDQDYYTVYANLDEFYVQNTDKVEKGFGLGRIIVDFKGNPSYLYFEIRRHEDAVDPAEWFQRL
ncbi:MAG: peptidoglycan DD-metalloendopeptidase family protein [Deferribacteraceae bacterium]|jgi:septal ring factor EnvC (AmiA/AmiB activator)|nr:peptidoglycan DD-metalloendopeptidase family protein [Deferribacteraceae bacterium]